MDFRFLALALAFLTLNLSSAWTEESASELDKIRTQFETHEELSQRPLAELGDRYREALVKLQNGLQKKADLNGLVVVRSELKRFDEERSPAAEASSLEAVSRLQEIYQAAHRKELSAIEEKLNGARLLYREGLEKLMRELTVAGKVDEALEVRSALEQIGDSAESGKVDLRNGLVLYFRFEDSSGEAVRDSSGARNDGRLMGDARISSTSGNRGRQVVFDGRGDFIEIPHHDTLALTTEGTISIWVRPKRLENTRGLVSKYTPKNSWTLRLWKDAERRKVSFGDFAHNTRSKAELNVDRWTHVVVTLSDGVVTFYMDGKLDSVGKRPTPLVSNTNAVRIGSCYDGRYFTGAIDDVRIYRRALSPEEVAELFETES